MNWKVFFIALFALPAALLLSIFLAVLAYGSFTVHPLFGLFVLSLPFAIMFGRMAR
jgi:hypothetical protein